ncbi:tetratricopeptide repeat protein [Streptomyces cinerochromogenes]|uniref:tetratricopeptide repeat protein n=1 Tax=Streptomyces cinerochromogenes TaxID=66422 RepID=UPI0033B5EFA7
MAFFRSRARRTKPSPVSRARALYQSGRYAEAEAEASAVVRSRPRDDMDVSLALTVAALSIGAQGRHAEALAAYDEALPVFGRIYGADHWQTLKLRSDRAQQLAALGRHAECEAESAAVVRAATRGTGPEMRLVAAAASNGVVFALNAQGRHVEAEALVREALARLREPDRLLLVLRLGLARSLNGQARYEEALAEAAGADELHRGLPPEQRGQEAGAVDLVAATALLGLGRDAEARVRAATAHDACLASFGPAHRRTIEARALLDRFDGV